MYVLFAASNIINCYDLSVIKFLAKTITIVVLDSDSLTCTFSNDAEYYRYCKLLGGYPLKIGSTGEKTVINTFDKLIDGDCYTLQLDLIPLVAVNKRLNKLEDFMKSVKHGFSSKVSSYFLWIIAMT